MHDRLGGISLRPAVGKDGGEICALYLASRQDALPHLRRLHSDEETLRWIVDTLMPASVVWVAASGARIVGFVALAGEEIEQLYIHPDYYRRGVGRRLLAKARELSRERLYLFTFQQNTRAQAFYEAHGFVATEFNDGSRNEEHEPDVKYQWTRAFAAEPRD